MDPSDNNVWKKYGIHNQSKKNSGQQRTFNKTCNDCKQEDVTNEMTKKEQKEEEEENKKGKKKKLKKYT